MKNQQAMIRNFAIVAHVDHGKSTLADRLLEATNTIPKRQMTEQILDSNPIERERGITIKLAPVRMVYRFQKTQSAQTIRSPEDRAIRLSEFSDYILNLIDTPGHVDFNYEVSRSLAACEGVLLVVDATQGIQAQTLANMHLVAQRKLTVIPVINKIDLPIARIADTRQQLIETFHFKESEIIEISAKVGLNIDKVLEAIIERIPPPTGNADNPLRALVFSSLFDPHRGVVVYVRIVDGSVKRLVSTEPNLTFMAGGACFSPIEVGYFTPRMTVAGELVAGEVGYIATGLKDVHVASVGDTISCNPDLKLPTTSSPLPGYREVKAMVFLGLFPIQSDDYLATRQAIEKLHLSDSAFTYRPISSLALGNGFHCGFLGLLHAEVVQERLRREFGLDLVATTPSVEYHLKLASGKELVIQNAAEFPDPSQIKEIQEPLMLVTIFTPKDFVGAVMQLAQDKRGVFHDMNYLGNQVKFTYTIPLSEMILDFFDRLKSATSGYASLDYEFFSYESVDAIKMDILIHHQQVDALSMIVVREQAQRLGSEMADRLKDVIPRQQFEIPIQAAIGGKIIARSDVKAFRKDVTQKLYGGDRTRKDKLLEAQKKGKKRMKMVGNVEIPQEAFLAVLRR